MIRRIERIQRRKIFISFLIIAIVVWWFKRPLPWYYPNDPPDVYISSAYYYPTSKSLGNNSLAFVFNGPLDGFDDFTYMDVRMTSGETKMTKRMLIEQTSVHIYCDWKTYFGTVQAIPNVHTVEISTGKDFFEIPMTQVSYEKKDVIICIAPLFANEQWQNVIYTAHIARKYNGFINMYIRSVVSPLFDLIKVYEKEGYLKVQPWERITLASIPQYVYNPNINILFRMQEAAHTDCLLQFKEATEYIAFLDLDDVLIPRRGTTYLEEFETFLTEEYTYLFYSREAVTVEADSDGRTFSLGNMYRSSEMIREHGIGKMVTRTENIDHAQIHFPGGKHTRLEEYEIRKENNTILHVKFRLGKGKGLKKFPNNSPYIFSKNNRSTIFKDEDIEEMERDFKKIRLKYPDVWETLPSDLFYLPLIGKCYYKKYYKYMWDYSSFPCPNPDICRLPMKSNISCVNTVGDFYSSAEGKKFSLHYGVNKRFVKGMGCIP